MAGFMVGAMEKYGLESPMEALFYVHASKLLDLQPQYQIGPYRVDFVHIESKLIVEIDGKDYHSSPEQVARDRRRTAYLESQGYKVKRFTGSRVKKNPVSCARLFYRFVCIRTGKPIDIDN